MGENYNFLPRHYLRFREHTFVIFDKLNKKEHERSNMLKQGKQNVLWLQTLLIALITLFTLTSECLAEIELPPLNSRGVIGLRWGNTLRQIQEGMRRNKGKLQSGPKNHAEAQVSYTYEGKFFEQEGTVTLTLHKGKLWAATFAYPNSGGIYEQFLALITSQYGGAESEKSGDIPSWIAGSNRIKLMKDSERVSLSWLDLGVAQKIRNHPDTPTLSGVGIEIPATPYIPQKLYQNWVPGEGLNDPFNPKNRGELFGLTWDISPAQAHLVMSNRNRGVFRGSKERLPSELWTYSAPMQGKFCSVEMLFLSKKLRGITLRFPSESLQVEQLYRRMLEEYLSPPLIKNNRLIWYYGKTSIVTEDSALGVNYRFSPGNI